MRNFFIDIGLGGVCLALLFIAAAFAFHVWDKLKNRYGVVVIINFLGLCSLVGILSWVIGHTIRMIWPDV